MSEHNNELRFALFKNDKGENAKRPDYRGTCQVNGAKYKMSAWIRKSQAGETYMSGQIEPDDRVDPATATRKLGELKQSLDKPAESDDVPF